MLPNGISKNFWRQLQKIYLLLLISDGESQFQAQELDSFTEVISRDTSGKSQAVFQDIGMRSVEKHITYL